MKKQQEQVADFMRSAGQAVAETPQHPPEVQSFLGISLIAEELEELRMATYVHKDLTQMLDAICDLLYVTLWFANAAGLPVEEGFDEVHRSNMSKFIDGYKDPNTGKWRKGPSYSEPKLALVIANAIKNSQ